LSKRSGLVVLVAALLAALMLVARAQPGDDDVKGWLDRMNVAVEELNYRGTFVHVFNQNAEILGIAHRYADGKVRERISTGGDDAREILRTNDIVLTVMPEERRVVVEELQSSSMPRTGALPYSENLKNLYEIHTLGKGEVAGRATQYVSIRPKDGYRYGYRLWLDRETGLPLKSQVTDEDSEVLEQIVFTAIEVVESVPEAEIVPAIGVDGFEWVRRIKAEPESLNDKFWGVTRLPDGFHLSSSGQSLLAGSTHPVQHLVYTDGLATVSVFIAHPESKIGQDIAEGLTRWGSMSMYSLRIDGRLATVMGEVPPRTVQRIATSLDAR
jgi:sigma-E factor negative regulatory protein RseB